MNASRECGSKRAFSGQAATAALLIFANVCFRLFSGKMSSSSREGCRCGRADCGLLISCELSAGSRILLTKRLLRACGNLCLRDLFDKIVGVSQEEGSVWRVEDVSLTLKLESDHLSDARKTLSARVCVCVRVCVRAQTRNRSAHWTRRCRNRRFPGQTDLRFFFFQ